MLLWLKEVFHRSQRKTPGMLSVRGTLPCGSPTAAHREQEQWEALPALLPSCQQCEQAEVSAHMHLVCIYQHNARAELQRVIPSGCWWLAQGIEPPSLIDPLSSGIIFSASETIVLKTGWRKGPKYLQQQEEKVYIPKYCKWQAPASKAPRQLCRGSSVPGRCSANDT